MTAQRRRRTRSPDPKPNARDNDASSFSPILLDLIARVPGALGAALVDRDGEAVDYAGRMDAYDLKLAGAHWQIALREWATLSKAHGMGTTRLIAVRGARRSFVTHALPDDYVLVVVLQRRAGLSPAPRAFSVCQRALAQEAGWEPLEGTVSWFSADVVENRTGRPSRLVCVGRELPLELLGRMTGLIGRESGWRVRLEDGAELMLVREAGGRWYSDEDVTALLRKEQPAARKG